MAVMQAGKAKFYIWTGYDITKVYNFDDKVQYAVWQVDKGSKSGKLHH